MTYKKCFKPLAQLLLACLFMVSLFGCSVYSETKAPCDYNGTFCGTKIAVNH